MFGFAPTVGHHRHHTLQVLRHPHLVQGQSHPCHALLVHLHEATTSLPLFTEVTAGHQFGCTLAIHLNWRVSGYVPWVCCGTLNQCTTGGCYHYCSVRYYYPSCPLGGAVPSPGVFSTPANLLPQIHTYHGGEQKDGETFQDWLEHFEAVAHLGRWDDTHKLVYLTSAL